MLVITILAILSAATGAVALASSTGTLNEPPAVADQEQGMASGAPFQDPPDAAVADGPDGDPTVTLDAHDTAFDLGGKWAVGQSYNGSYVAPTIHFSPGANYTYRLAIPADHPQGTMRPDETQLWRLVDAGADNIGAHEDNGMMSFLNVVSQGG